MLPTLVLLPRQLRLLLPKLRLAPNSLRAQTHSRWEILKLFEQKSSLLHRHHHHLHTGEGYKRDQQRDFMDSEGRGVVRNVWIQARRCVGGWSCVCTRSNEEEDED